MGVVSRNSPDPGQGILLRTLEPGPHDLLVDGFQRRQEHLVLARKVPVQRTWSHAGGVGDPRGCRTGEAVLRNHLDHRIDDLLAPFSGRQS